MNYVSLPYSNSSHVKVPFICKNHVYQRGMDWDGFPETMGYKLTRTKNGEQDLTPFTETTPKLELDGFLQSWLWFGLLTEFSNITPWRPSVDPGFTIESTSIRDSKKTYSSSNENQRIVDTEPAFISVDHVTFLDHSNLYTGLEILCNEFYRAGTRRKKDTSTKLRELHRRLVKAYSVLHTCMRVCIANNKKDTESEQTKLNFLSIKILLETLIHTMHAIWGLGLLDNRDLGCFYYFWTYRRMKEAGWCPSAIYRVHVLTLASTCYYMTYLTPPQVTKHSECSERGCKLLDVDDRKYQTKHRGDVYYTMSACSGHC